MGRRFRVVLDKMLALFEAQTEFQFIGMSLFVCYDADLLAREMGPIPRVYFIDFAHYFPADGVIDQGVLLGLRSVKAISERLLAECSDDAAKKRRVALSDAPGGVCESAPQIADSEMYRL